MGLGACYVVDSLLINLFPRSVGRGIRFYLFSTNTVLPFHRIEIDEGSLTSCPPSMLCLEAIDRLKSITQGFPKGHSMYFRFHERSSNDGVSILITMVFRYELVDISQ